MTVLPHPDFLKAGKIAGRVLTILENEVRPGVKVLKVCRLAEEKILELGATGVAFPCNVSINNEAAHYTSPYDDKRIFPDRGLVKVDIGAHVNGYISDTAITVDLDGSYEHFIAAAKNALDAALEMVRPGVRVGEVGEVIERTVKKYGLRPVHQLSGHQLRQWMLHAGKNVPNIGQKTSPSMNLGETYAIEPFATNGNGTIRSGQTAYIFSNDLKNKKKLDPSAQQVRSISRQLFKSLPWASRWLHDNVHGVDVDIAIKALIRAGAIHGYPVLFEGKDGMVSQFEHSVFVGEEGAIVSTRRQGEV
ncbi:MAG: type II methionyl aminopeptidase [Candidatus Thorarchaeota archaeon]|nr:MAG: type II methionyl aminopeptidase [Candidatus Thorarchaeota archaeon]